MEKGWNAAGFVWKMHVWNDHLAPGISCVMFSRKLIDRHRITESSSYFEKTKQTHTHESFSLRDDLISQPLENKNKNEIKTKNEPDKVKGYSTTVIHIFKG